MNVRQILSVSVALLFAVACNREPTAFVAVNLAGYNADDTKQALLVNSNAKKFEIVRSEDQRVVYQGAAGDKADPDTATGDAVFMIDFTGFTEKGTYFIRTTEFPDIHSGKFNIDEDVYSSVTETILQSYYYHRCGTKVDNGEQWRYETCHLKDAVFYEARDQYLDTAGGWHDAGDYNKFSINTALSAALLLSLYEIKSAAFYDSQLNIPESGNGVPDLLDEVSWALEWLMKMQHPDGSIYHKISQKEWVGEFLPHLDPESRYIFEPSSSATAGFAAVAAQGARLLQDHNREFANELTSASLKAWKYLEENPRLLPEGGFRNPPDVFGGEYSDTNDTDERLWASIELYKRTKEVRFLNYFESTYRELSPIHIPPLSWKNFHSLAFSSFLHLNDRHESQEVLSENVMNLFISHADSILEKRNSNNYLNLIHHTEYYWGSNSVGLAYAFDLIQMFRLTKNREYRDAALDQFHYVLGRNPFNLSQITSVGSRSVQNPYHQLSEMGGFDKPVPGMLVGGPNNHLQLGDTELSPFPGKNYEDTFQNYLVNEPAINFTAVLAYISGFFSLTPEPIVKIE